MKKLSLLVLGFAFACNSSQKTVAEAQQPKPVASPVSYAESITQEDVERSLSGFPGQRSRTDDG